MRNQSFDMLRRRRASKEELCAEGDLAPLEFRAEEEHLSGGEDAVLTRQMADYLATPAGAAAAGGARHLSAGVFPAGAGRSARRAAWDHQVPPPAGTTETERASGARP